MDAVEEIKARLPIEDLVGRYVDLKRSGASFKGLCPFHQEKTPSFYVTPSRGTFHCFGCAKGGDVFGFLMEIERLQFREALERLAEQTGVQLPDRRQDKPSVKGKLYEINEAAAKWFKEMLLLAQGTRARQYLEERRFDQAAIDRFELGWAPEGRDGLVQQMRKAGFEERVPLLAGLAIQEEIGSQTRDRFRGRLIFPIRDASGRLTGFGGRTLGDNQPKYLNSPQTEIFDKSSVLYGIHLAADPIRKDGTAVLVEGYLDAVRAHLSGYATVVASLGTAVTVAQLTALSRQARSVILALDPDPAGQEAAARAALTALAEVTKSRGRSAGEVGTVDLRVAVLPDGEGDPDKLIRDKPELWELAIAGSTPAFEFYFQQTLGRLDRSTEAWRQEAIDRLLPVIQQFADSAGWQAIWVQRLAKETSLDPRVLQRSLPVPRAAQRRSPSATGYGPALDTVRDTTSRSLTADPAAGIEQALLALLLRMIVLPPDAREQFESVQLERSEHQAILAATLAWAESGNYEYELLRESLPEEVRDLADELRARDVPLPADGRTEVAVAFHLARLRQFRLQSQLRRATETLVDVDGDGLPVAVGAVGRLNTEQKQVEELLDRLSRQLLQGSTGAAQ